MSQTMQSLGIDQLSLAERLTLVHDIWDSIANESPQPALTDGLRTELDRRLDEDDAAADDVIPWEVVKTEAAARSRQS